MKGYGFAIPFLYFFGLNVCATLDLIYRKQKYQDYLSRLEALKGDNSSQRDLANQELADINDRLSDCLKNIKQLTDKAVIQQSYYLLGVPVTLLLIYQFYLKGFSLATLFLVLLIGFAIIAHNVMKSHLVHNQKLTPTVDVNSAELPTYLISKLSYISSGLDIKKYRIILLGIFFVLFFPPLLYYAFSLLDHTLTPSVVWLISFVLSAGYWSFYFNKQLGMINDIEEKLSAIDYELTLLLTPQESM